MSEPLVSIIIPVYNGSNYMKEAIESALLQTYKNTEVIVVNDGSCDGGKTDAIARSYGDKIRYFVKENGGVSSALNKGIEEMSGEYFSWLSHDDVYEPDKVEKQVSALKKAGNDALIYCQCMQIDEKSRIIKGYKRESYFKPNIMYNSEEVLCGLLKKATFNGCGLLIPKKAFIDNGMFDESLRFCQDAFMWYKIFSNHSSSLFCIDDVLVKSRVHANQLTQTAQSLFIKECNKITDFLTETFAEISTDENNFLRMYLFSDAKFLQLDKIQNIIAVGQKYGLISVTDKMKAYLLCGYGKVRPFIRKCYYRFFRNIKTG